MVAPTLEASWMRLGVPFAGTDEQPLLSAMVTASPTAITVVDLGGVALLWNPAAERLFGWASIALLASLVASRREWLGAPLFL